MASSVFDSIVTQTSSRIVYLVADGLGGLPVEDKGGSELEVARTPNLDDLARRSACGLFDPVAPGVTPGSGPGHLALFGYDPEVFRVGRGVLAALGIGFDITSRDLAARVNFCTIGGEGKIVDRRAGRISSEENERICAKVREGLHPPSGTEVFLQTVSEHRALLVIRADGLSAAIGDTDPQRTGVPANPPTPGNPDAQPTARIVSDVLAQIHRLIADEERANGVLARGFDCKQDMPSMKDRYGLDATAIAKYPMYRGLASLVGMEVLPPYGDLSEAVTALGGLPTERTFVFLHFKDTDKAGEDGDFDAKVAALEKFDAIVPEVLATGPDVLVVAGDHSTPAALAAHSWHPVPVILHARAVRSGGAQAFSERECARGDLGRLPMFQLLRLALAHAGKLAKFGA